MTSELVVGIDIATANVRVGVHDRDGTRVAAADRALPRPERSGSGCSEQDAGSWWPAVRDCLAECTATLGARRARIGAVAIAATSGTVVLADARGNPVTPALMYDDRRAESEAATAARVGAARWRRSGLIPSAGSGLARIARLAAHAPVEAAVACHTPDLVAWQLVGHPVATDSSHALKSGYDILDREWASEVFTALAVPPELLPPVVRPTTPLGVVGSPAASTTGLPEGCVVHAGMTDGCAGQLATGAVEVGQFVTVLGTTMVLKGVSERLVHDPLGTVYSHQHPNGTWLPGGAANVGGSALSDVATDRLAALDEAAARRGPSAVVQYPLRGTGERFPFLAHDASRFLRGEPADEVDEYRSRLEGIAFCERLALEHLTNLGAPVSGPVRTAGGGARSTAWARVRASVLGRPVLSVREADTSRGAALLAAVGSTYGTLSAAAVGMVPVGELIEPEPTEVEPLEENYQRFRAELRARSWLTAE